MGSVSFECTADDLIAAQRLYLSHKFRSRRVLRAYFLGVVILGGMAGLGARYLLGDSGVLAAVLGAAYWTIFLTAIFLIGYLRVPPQARRVIREQKSLHGRTEIRWDEERISFTSPRGETRYDWGDYVSIFVGSQAIVLLQSEAMMNFIPTRILAAEQVTEFAKRAAGLKA